MGVGEGTEERVELLVKAGVDAIVVDTAHGHSAGVIERVRWVKRHYPKVDVIGGNIATGAAALALVEAGADAVKVGIGPGSICTTRIVTGVGVPQIMAIEAVANALKGSGVPLIADGGIRYSGDIAKAIAAGADSVMMGGMFAGTEEAPGEIDPVPGPQLQELPRHGLDRRHAAGQRRPLLPGRQRQQPEHRQAGARGHRGPGAVQGLGGGDRSSRWPAACAPSMHYCGCATIEEMQRKAEFVEITTAGMRESHVHDVQITKEAPNYRME